MKELSDTAKLVLRIMHDIAFRHGGPDCVLFKMEEMCRVISEESQSGQYRLITRVVLRQQEFAIPAKKKIS